MRDVVALTSTERYRSFACEEVFADRDVLDDAQVSTLVEWVLVHRAPLCAQPSDPSSDVRAAPGIRRV